MRAAGWRVCVVPPVGLDRLKAEGSGRAADCTPILPAFKQGLAQVLAATVL
jgi:hypothetical protein